MNIFSSSRTLAGLIALILASILVNPVLATQVYTLQVTLSVVQASPGATIEITGTHFEPDVAVTFVLFQKGNQAELGNFIADDHGDFETSVLLPYDLPFGEYEFRGVDEKGDFAAVPLTIVPDPIGEEAGQSREDEDGLLAPMPTFEPGVAPGSVSQPAAQPLSAEVTASNRNPTLLVVLILLLVGILIVSGLRFTRKR